LEDALIDVADEGFDIQYDRYTTKALEEHQLHNVN
jgi:hypothetical protein